MGVEEYNGHATYAHWEVSATIANIEGLYDMARSIAQSDGATKESADWFIAQLAEQGIFTTPGGTPYTWTTVLAALEEYVEEEES